MKKQRIVVTGSMGYLATELLKLMSGEARYKDIIAIDNRFVSARVSQLRHWGIAFHQVSILDKERLGELLVGADVVYHLAGITDVAYTTTQSNPEQDDLINTVGIGGTMNVIRSIDPNKTKLIFPSTHVVYEGLKETTFGIGENMLTQPVLTYAKGKVISERDINQWLNNWCVVRLGSVYGYSTDTMRINIMPNLFSKIASQNGTINLFGGGVQYKSMVHVIDVVRAMKFLAESDHTGTYHLSNENMTVKQVAEICKEVNPSVILTETTDEIPNKGYTLSNSKLLATGFQFRYNIKDAIADMIHRWSEQNLPQDLEYIIHGGKDYIDERGKISNYELPEPINLIGWIESKKGTVRANHYHPIQEQKCLLISGRYISVIKDLSIPDAPLSYKVIRPGDVAVIKPNVAHAMVFLKDSLFLNLVNGEREHENYGITHTIPYKLVDNDMKDSILNMYKSTCRICNHDRLQTVVNLGTSPLANNLLNNEDDPCDKYPLEMMWCPKCFNCQLSVVVPAEKLFDNYLYVSSTSPVFREHFQKAADSYIDQFNPSTVWDIGSNDGIALKPFQQRGIKVCGIEPAANIARIAAAAGVPTVHGYFNQGTALHAYTTTGTPDIIMASNVFAHADDIAAITRTVFANLSHDGIFIIEVQYLMDTIKDLTFDNIYHEHVNYWSVTALANFFDLQGYCMFHVEHIDTHGGSIRCYISKDTRYNPSVQRFLAEEKEQEVHNYGTYQQFRDRVFSIRNNVRRNIASLKQSFSCICGYGSPAKATTSLNFFDVTSEDIMYTIDDNTLKNAKWIPGTGIQIWEQDDMFKDASFFPDLCIVFAWNFFDSIKSKLPQGILCISIKDLEKHPDDFLEFINITYRRAHIDSMIVTDAHLNKVLSIYGSHDASASFVDKDQKLRVIEYERFVKRRYSAFTHKFDKQADSTLFCSNQQERTLFIQYIYDTIYQVPEYIVYEELDIQDIKLVQSFFPDSKMVYMNRKHHTCHAASAYLTSSFERAFVISFDGGGGEDDVTYTRTYIGENSTVVPVKTYSIDFGTPYALIGYPIAEIGTPDDLVINLLANSGKVMGLCAYGTVRQEWIEPMKRFYINSPYLGWEERLKLLGEGVGMAMNRNAISGQRSYDLAATSQYTFETLFFEVVVPDIADHTNVILTGGCALNVLLNQKVRNYCAATGKNLYIPCIPSDCGLSLGQLLYSTGTRVSESIAYCGLELLDMPHDEGIPGDILSLLVQGSIIGIIEGLSEVGPRALGNRSIICLPGQGMKDKLNIIKSREWFRPFAPVCRIEDAGRYFNSDACDYMSYCPTVSEQYRDQLPSITHVDGTARLQTVTEKSHPLFYSILTRLEEQGHIPVILNTSFNIKGRPIISTYADAMDILYSTTLDAVYSYGKLYTKR